MLQIVFCAVLFFSISMMIAAYLIARPLWRSHRAVADYQRLRRTLPAVQAAYRRQGSKDGLALRSIVRADRYLKKCEELYRTPRRSMLKSKDQAAHYDTLRHMARTGLKHLEQAQRRIRQIEQESASDR
jgi:hypothetical protein